MITTALANREMMTSTGGVVLNSRGFPALPNELYSEVLSHLQAMPIPQFAYREETPTDPHRYITLRALSQTCRSLRSFFLQYAWERVEVFGGMCTPSGTIATKDERRNCAEDMRYILDAKFAEEILHQLEMVTLINPDLGQFVRIVNIIFVNSSHRTVIIQKLAQNLTLLPHVHTLQIIFTEFDLTPTNFSQYSYPQIQTVCVQGSRIIHEDILPACPNLTSYIQYRYGIVLLEQLLKTCPSRLQVLGVLSTIYPLPLEALTRGLPQLRDITVDHLTLRANEDNLGCLSLLPLHTLRLCLTVKRYARPYSHATYAERDRWIGLAKKILRECPIHESDVVQKRVVVIENGRSVEIHPAFA